MKSSYEEDTHPERTNPIVWGIYAVLVIGGASWFVLEKTDYDPTVASGLVTGIVSIIVGVIAAYVGAQTTLQATNKAHENALAIQTERTAAQTKGIIQALYTDLKCLWDMYEMEFHQDFEELQVGQPFLNYFKLGGNYFSIFDSNSAFIGQIPDPELRQSIVLAYLRAKSLVDSHHLNNKLQDEATRLANAQSITTDPVQIALIESARQRWQAYSPQLKWAYLEAKKAVTTALELLEPSAGLEREESSRPISAGSSN